MNIPLILARFSHKFSYLIDRLPPDIAIWLYSYGRQQFMKKFANHSMDHGGFYIPSASFERVLWGIKFRSNIMNAAGMFKNGECYDLVANQGAGGYIGGTSTHNMRLGNFRNGIHLPFLSIHNKQLAINFLGLPNQGDSILSSKIITCNKVYGCPIGWSLMRSPDFDDNIGLDKLIESLFLYHDKEHIDFIEINESCPNTSHGNIGINQAIYDRLSIIANKFLRFRERNLPVIVKFSNDINPIDLNQIIIHLVRLGFDGINLGNTSTRYSEYSEYLSTHQKKLFEYFIDKFGGGVSGDVLKRNSLMLCSQAIDYIKKINPVQEFNVIRCGGINSKSDLVDSDNIGIALNQWYTGYFTNYIKFGDKLYREF